MKQFNGYDEAKKAAQSQGNAQIPVGAYVCEIKNVKMEEYTWGNVILLQFDVIEGEQKDFFANQYKENTSEDKKWKGNFRLNCPKDDGSKEDGWTKNAFAKWTDSFEKSNTGYTWDWDEAKWKGKKIGLVFGQTGSVTSDGKEIVFTECHGCCSVDDVRNNTFYKKLLDFKARKGYTGNQANQNQTPVTDSNGFMNIPDGIDEELPFN